MAELGLKRQHMEYIFVALLVVVAVLAGLMRFKKKELDDEVFSRKEFNRKWQEVEVLEANVPKKEKAVDYVVDDGQIPFRSPFEVEKAEVVEEVDETIQLPAMAFQGMIWSSKRPQTIINNAVYDVGDTIYIGEGVFKDEIKVKTIETDGIHLRYKGKEFIVRPK